MRVGPSRYPPESRSNPLDLLGVAPSSGFGRFSTSRTYASMAPSSFPSRSSCPASLRAASRSMGTGKKAQVRAEVNEQKARNQEVF